MKIHKAAILDKMEARANPKSHALIFTWRKEMRVRLIAHRLATEANDKRQRQSNRAASVASYRAAFRTHGKFLLAISRRAGSSAFNANRVEKKAPLVFRLWQPGGRLVPGVWNIPIPADGDEVLPDVVIAPVVGFDSACYRLGYGGGFFDRTLATLPHALAIGVGYDAAAISTIYPLPHDVPMEAIVTERGILKPRSERKPEE